MSITPITFKKSDLTVVNGSYREDTFKLSDKVTCKWNRKLFGSYGPIDISWEFDWEKLRNDGIDGLYGQITLKSTQDTFPTTNVDVDLTEGIESVKAIIPTNNNRSSYEFSFEISLLPYSNGKVSYEEMFLPSDQNDAILVVEEKKLHVNKAFLSYHSEFFRALFSSNFKEGQMDEIPIKDVSYEDLCLLLGSFHPKPVFPNDKTVEKLLEMADRFATPSVIGIVEYHLIHNSKIKNEKMMWMADVYGMPNLLQKTIRQMNTAEKAKALKASSDYKKLSNDTKALVLDRVMGFI